MSKKIRKEGKTNLPKSYRLRKSACEGIIRAMWASLNSPFAGTLAQMNFKEAVEWCISYKLDVNSYTDPLEYFKDAQAIALVKKNLLFRNKDASRVALKKYFECEQRMEEVNKRFSITTPCIADARVESILFIAQRKIGSWLENVEPFNMRYNRFGPGASYEAQPDTSAFAKIKDHGQLTLELVPYFHLLRKEFPGIFGHKKPDIVEGSRLSFVPKNKVTDRPIAIEPSINMFLQLGLGSTLKHVLLENGCNLFDQTRNQALAASAHRLSIATVDLSSASDLISTTLVASLLPPKWYAAMDLVRSKQYTLDGTTFKPFHKFSTMGNGFTFELETMIFYAIALSICEHENVSTQYVSVYGDDIIIPREIGHLLYEILDHIGACPNTEKSFLKGNFFESCGEDYFMGYGVRPVYIDFNKRYITDVYQIFNDWIKIRSRIRSLASIYSSDTVSVSGDEPVLDSILRAIPSALHFYGPKTEGRERAYLFHPTTGIYPGRCGKGNKGIRESTRRVDLSSLLDDEHVLSYKLYSPARVRPYSRKEILENLLSHLEPLQPIGYNVRAGGTPGFQLNRKLVNLV